MESIWTLGGTAKYCLQETLVLSYKDAAHRLYMAELEKVWSNANAYKAFMNVQETTKKALEKVMASLKDV